MALAPADALALVSILLIVIVRGTFVTDIVIFSVSRATRQIGVQITKLLAVVRFIKLIIPFRSEQLFNPFSNKLGSGWHYGMEF